MREGIHVVSNNSIEGLKEWIDHFKKKKIDIVVVKHLRIYQIWRVMIPTDYVAGGLKPMKMPKNALVVELREV